MAQDTGQVTYSALSGISAMGDTRYMPAAIDVDNFAVGVSEGTLSNLNLLSEHLIVGERRVDTGYKSYGLIVDDHGVLINSTLPNRSGSDAFMPYALHVEGSVYVSGSLHASNIILDIPLDGDLAALASAAASNPWRLVNQLAHSNAAFYDGYVTIGNESFASISTHPIFVVGPGDRAIQRSQFAIANTQLSKLNVGIIGNAEESPVVFNSVHAPIEFNVGRSNAYYTERYTEVYPDVFDNNTLKIRPAHTPRYTGQKQDAPHFAIDKFGNVGVHIAETPTITYQRRERIGTRYDPSVVDYNEQMAFAVNGPMYASNILIHDPDTNTPKDLNIMFARVQGTYLPAKQVIPGVFGGGDYTFPISLSIAASNESANGFGFVVGSNSHFLEHVVMDKNLTASNIQSQLLVNTHGVDFLSSLNIDGTTNAYGDLVVHKGISIAELLPDGSNYAYTNVQFTAFNSPLSNINYFGRGITTPGRFGAGISPNIRNDTPEHMVTIRNREFHLPKLYELEMMDLRDPNIKKVAFVGHTHTSSNMAGDASLVVSTPHALDRRYNITSTYFNPVQNIYLYPGHDQTELTAPLIRLSNPPVFGAFAPQRSWRLREWADPSNPEPSDIYGRCGINTFFPKAELHVEGAIAFTQNLIRIDPNTGIANDLGLWSRLKLENTVSEGGPQRYGIQYLDQEAAHVGVNTLPAADYGMVVAGKIKSLNGYFTVDDKEIVSWIRPTPETELQVDFNALPMYSQGPIGIGITNPKNVLELRNRVNGPTYVHLTASESDPRVGFKITGGTGDTDGTGEAHTWYLQDNSTTNAFEIFATRSSGIGSTAKHAVQIVRNSPMDTYNVFINRTPGIDITSPMSNLSANAALTVCGDLNVIGNVYSTQNYHSSNIIISSSNIQTNTSLSNLSLLGTDDVFIAGRNVHMLPINGAVIVGANAAFMQRISQETSTNFGSIPMRVNNGSTDDEQHPVGLSLSTTKNQCYLEFNALGRRLWMGLDNERFTVKRVDNTTGASIHHFMTFADVEGAEGLGINELNPKALVHISNSSSNQFRVTRKVLTSLGDAYPSIQLETLTTSDPLKTRMWSIAGPDFNTNDKLAFFYKTEEMTSGGIGEELFTFAKNGGLGIGNTNPSFAVDVKNVGKFGGVRLWNTDNNAEPQLVFQSGISEEFGGDPQTDYRMLAFSNTFEFNAQTLGSGSIPIMEVKNNGQIGFGVDPFPDNDLIRLNVMGGINITDTLYVNGIPLFGSNKRDGFTFDAMNIFIIPTAVAGGSFLVNSNPQSKTGTGNLFQIYVNALDDPTNTSDGVSRGIVLDGQGDEVQLTFRTHEPYEQFTAAYMYRQWQKKTLFGLEFIDPAPTDEIVEFGHEGWSNVVTWEPLLSPTIRNQFTMRNFGDIELVAPSPKITLGDASNPLASSVGQSNGHLWMQAGTHSNIGIGTKTPSAFLHILNGNAAYGTPALFVEHVIDNSNHLAVFGNMSNPDVVITADGRLGVNVGNVVNSNVVAEIGGVLATNQGTVASPTIAFRNDLSTGWWSPSNATTALSAGGVEAVRFDAKRAVGMGTTAPTAHLHIRTNNVSIAHTAAIPSVRIDYDYQAPNNTPVFDIYASNAVVIRATNDARIGFGTYPTTSDFQVAKEFEFESSGTFNKNVIFKENILVYGDVRHRGVVTHDSDIRLKSDLQRIDGALDKIEKLTGYTYHVNGTPLHKRSTGLIAQDVAEVLPEAVEEHHDTGTLGVAYGNMMGLIVEALKELRGEVQSIKKFVGMK